jgi:hypothetical protein
LSWGSVVIVIVVATGSITKDSQFDSWEGKRYFLLRDVHIDPRACLDSYSLGTKDSAPRGKAAG